MAGYVETINGGENEGWLSYVVDSGANIYEYVIKFGKRNSFCHSSSTPLAIKLAWSTLSF